MSLTESEILRNIGLVFLDNIAALTTFAFLQGAAVPIYCASIHLLIQKGLRFRPSLVIFAASTLSFLLTMLYMTAFVGLFIVEIKGVFIDPFTTGKLDVARLEAVNTRTFNIELLFSWSSLLPPIISDAIVVWRAWVLCGQRRRVLIGPIALLLGSFAASLTYSILTSSYSSFSNKVACSPCSFGRSDRHQLDKYVHPFRRISCAAPCSNSYAIYALVALILSFATNVCSTVLVLLQLRSYQRSVIGLGFFRKRTQAQKILVMLVDSGLIYCSIQLIFLSLVSIPFTRLSTANTVYSVLVPIYLVFTGMYPSIIVVLVGYMRPLLEETFVFSEPRGDGVDLEYRPARPESTGHLSISSFPTDHDYSARNYGHDVMLVQDPFLDPTGQHTVHLI